MKLAKEIMVTQLVTLDPETPVLSGIQRLVHANIKGAPVIDRERNYLGIFTERCCLVVLTTLCESRNWANFSDSGALLSSDFMNKQLWVLRPEMDVYDAVNFLLAHRMAGAPVVDEHGHYLGMFSEKNSMSVLIGAIYDGLPSAHVSAYMDPDPRRIIDEDMDIHQVAELFLHTTFRRFVVVRDDRVVGQIARNNVLLAAQPLIRTLAKSNKASRPSWTASAFMDSSAKTIAESLELFSIANIFRKTAQRRLPVLRGKLLVGQITRKNLLSAANEVLNRPPVRRVEPLYLASVPGAQPPGM